MKKLKINVDQLVEERHRHFSNYFDHFDRSIMFFKLSFEEAMLFETPLIHREDSPIDYYGEDRLIKEGEFYDGYAVCAYLSIYWHFVVVRMRGAINHIPADEPDRRCWGDCPPEWVKTGNALRIECPPENGVEREWIFVKVLTFVNYYFKDMVRKIQDCSDELQDVNVDALDKSLRGKLLKGLLSEDKIIELTREEDMVLHASLATQYKRIFERLN